MRQRLERDTQFAEEELEALACNHRELNCKHRELRE